MKIISENKVDEAALKHSREYVDFDENSSITEEDLMEYSQFDFKAGVTFAESKVQDYVKDIIIENQGLKLYKDNESKRFVEFIEWILNKGLMFCEGVEDMTYRSSIIGGDKYTSEELYKNFIKEKDGKI